MKHQQVFENSALAAARWIWPQGVSPPRNVYARFRRTFEVPSLSTLQKALLHITACWRYRLFVNGEPVGEGPPRGWPDLYFYDTYDLTPVLKPGTNLVAVLVAFPAEGTMQWIPTAPGLLAAVEIEDPGGHHVLRSDPTWKARFDPSREWRAPRISIQMSFEEQVNGRRLDAWTELNYDDGEWLTAAVIDEHEIVPSSLHPRPIAFLTHRPRLPVACESAGVVTSARFVWHLHLKPLFNPHDRSANFVQTCAFLFTQIYAPEAGSARLLRFHVQGGTSRVFLNGREVPVVVHEPGHSFPVLAHELELRAGWNTLLVDLFQRSQQPRFVAALHSALELHVSWNRTDATAWALVGPFDCPEARRSVLLHFPFLQVPTTTPTRGPVIPAQELSKRGETTGLLTRDLAQPIPESLQADDDVFVRAWSDRFLSEGQAVIQQPEALLGSAGCWTRVEPSAAGEAVRLLLDFGRVTVGFVELEVEAGADTVIDVIGFEHRRPDGRLYWTEGTNNSLRYVCSEGRQRFRSFLRRGGRYLLLILRKMQGPVLLRSVAVIENIAPQQNLGAFSCSDPLLERIWEVGAWTLACCSEDTYVDCPTYEQVFWVGDARNEALVDWVVNGDSRLWRHSLLLAGHSLKRSPLIESHVPSAWTVILPAWSFLWMRSCREYLLHTGDFETSRILLDLIVCQVEAAQEHLNTDGLFEIRAWNMFDWAAMDTPDDGVVTHQNCLLVLALREAADLARWLQQPTLAQHWQKLAGRLAGAINAHLYDSRQQAYSDARHSSGRLSRVISQQTQTVALAAGVATGERRRRAWQALLAPPENMVRAGSPFFLSFLLEVLLQRGRVRQALQHIRRHWGAMIREGATTFWEMWSGPPERPTRSHCHGWSAAPTYFLSTALLGVRPRTPGFQHIDLAPRGGDLQWAAGRVPTPYGPVQVEWHRQKGGHLHGRVVLPRDLSVRLRLPTPQSRIHIEVR